MKRHFLIAIGLAATLVISSSSSFSAEEASFGSEQEAKAMLEKAVAALKADKAKALAMFNKGEGGFKDRDLYVFCANASDGVLTAHPYLKGELLQSIVGKKGFPLGKAIMERAAEGKIQSVTYWWPRPGTKTPSRSTPSTRRSGIRSAGSDITRSRCYRRSCARLLCGIGNYSDAGTERKRKGVSQHILTDETGSRQGD